MNKFCTVLAFVAICCLALSAANAQSIKVYFDQDYTEISQDCGGLGMMGTMYVVAEDFGCWMLAFEYQLLLPPSMTVIGEITPAPLKIGNSVNGISLVYSTPQNCYGDPLLLSTILFQWNCTDCSVENELIEIVQNSNTVFLGGVRWPDGNMVPSNGGHGYVCRNIKYYLDIKPGSCPNPFNVHLFYRDEEKMPKPDKGGMMPVAILGSPEFDVTDIDVSTIRLEGVPISVRGKSGIAAVVTDVGTPPMNGDMCPCSTEGPDGISDLQMKFLALAVADAITPGEPGDVITLTLTGNLLDGEPFAITDCITIVGPGDKYPTPISTAPLLSAASPNPFNPVTRIHYYIPEEAPVQLGVFDVRGRLVAMLVNQVVSGGDHVVTWEAPNAASGVYFYRLKTGDFLQTRKMILLK